MNDKLLKRQHQIFVDQMIAHGDPTKAYMVAYPKSSENTARTNSYKLLQKTAINAAIKEHTDKITAAVTEEVTAVAKKLSVDKLLTSHEKRAILAKIAKGRLKIQDEIMVEGKKVKYMRRPNLYERLRAIAIDNLMTGDHLTKQDVTSAGQPLPSGDKTFFKLPDGTEIEI